MFYVTGDTHGDLRAVVRFCKKHNLSSDDTVVILGDAGINYFGNQRDRDPRHQLAKTPVTVFCIHGNHEQRPQTLDCYEEVIWNGGAVYQEPDYPNILFAKDGEIYDLDGLKAIVIGGAYSVDKFIRLEKGWSWFADEQPDAATKAFVELQLDAVKWQVDVVLSHTCPYKYEPREVFLDFIDQSTVDKTTEHWLDTIEQRLTYRKWYCGHYHTDKSIDRLQFMFHDFDYLDLNGEDSIVRARPMSTSPLNFYTSDLHLGHANIIKICNRPFTDVNEMNETLIKYWNARVRPCDHVYVVGDLAFRSPQSVKEYIERLQGIKHLILGNHDRSWISQVRLADYFESIEQLQLIEDGNCKVVLCHYPMMSWGGGKNSYLVYGHIHNNKNSSYWSLLRTYDRALNASVEVNDYQPVTLNELIANNKVFRQGSDNPQSAHSNMS